MVVTNNPAQQNTMVQAKWFMMDDAVMKKSEQALSSSSSPYPVGSQLAGTAVDFTIAKLGLDAVNWVQRFDCYSIDCVEITATVCARIDDSSIKSLPVIMWSFEDRDSPQEVQCNWGSVRNRQNVARCTFRANNPSMTIAKIKPVPLFDGAIDDSAPANLVLDSKKWIDALAVKQRFNGIRVFTACPQVDSQGQSYSYTVALEARVKVQGKAAL